MRTTEHGENIADQIQGEDAYGSSGPLNLADIWLIIDNLHSSFCETPNEEYCRFLERWMRELEGMDDSLPPI